VKWRSTKNKHLLVIYSIPARGFTAAVSVFRGTPPPKPLECKSVSNHPGARFRSRWAHPTGEESPLLRVLLGLAVTAILKTSSGHRSQIVTFRCCRSRLITRKQKTLLARGKQGLEIVVRWVTCLPPVDPSLLRGAAHDTAGNAQGETHSRDSTGHDAALPRPTLSAKSWLNCSCSISSNLPDV
jgi:hypothetical protein